jgi:hypothetical protein
MSGSVLKDCSIIEEGKGLFASKNELRKWDLHFVENKSLGIAVHSEDGNIVPVLYCGGRSDQKIIFLKKLTQSPLKTYQSLLGQVFQAVNKYCAHAINGKIMGLKGLVECWSEEWPEAESVQSDLELIQSTLDEVKHQAELLGWMSKKQMAHMAIVQAPLAQTIMEPFLRGLNPQFNFEVKGKSIEIIPQSFVFWITSAALALRGHGCKASWADMGEGHELNLICQSDPFMESQDLLNWLIPAGAWGKFEIQTNSISLKLFPLKEKDEEVQVLVIGKADHSHSAQIPISEDDATIEILLQYAHATDCITCGNISKQQIRDLICGTARALGSICDF